MSKGNIGTIKLNVAKKPLQNHSVASRCLCMVCGKKPNVEAERIGDGSSVSIKASCCGQSETRTVRKEDLFYTQRFFNGEAAESDDGGDLIDM